MTSNTHGLVDYTDMEDYYEREYPESVYPVFNPDRPSFALIPPTPINYRLAKNAVCPTVGDILEVIPSDKLEEWKNIMINMHGEERFKEIERQYRRRGIIVHKMIEDFLNKKQSGNVPTTHEYYSYWKSVSGFLKNLEKNVIAVETGVVHAEHNYRGYIDCIALIDGKPTIIEWKTSEDHKADITTTFKSRYQVAGYIGALNADPNYSFNVTDALIVIINGDGSPATEFKMDKDCIVNFWRKWMYHVEYHKHLRSNWKFTKN